MSIASIENIPKIRDSIFQNLERVIVGQRNVIEEILIALFSQGHILLVGVPGLAKTLLIKTLAKLLDLNFNRIQFTPDLMPTDIIGTDILEEHENKKRTFKFLPGPIFANVILADEINRTPPKTQSALLQAMQELQVTAGGTTYNLEPPFFVLATQNPIEHEGTYPLPEAQLDRFMFNIKIDYPTELEEREIVKITTTNQPPDLKPILSRKEILIIQEYVRRVPIADYVIEYAVSLVNNSRPVVSSAPKFIKELVSWGAGLRASQCLVLGAKARALLYGKTYVSCEDIEALVYPVFRHRIIPNFAAEAEGVNVENIIEKLLQGIQPPKQ